MKTSPSPAAHSPVIKQLAELARELGADSVSLGVSNASVAILVAAGAALTRRVLRHGHEQPYVIATASLAISGLVIEAARPSRPASPGEARALLSNDAYFYLGSYQGVDLTND